MNILITGASGSGTTTFGKYSAKKMNWNHIDADDYYWIPTNPPFENKRNFEERLNLILHEIKENDSNIISGSVMNWGKKIEDIFDLIVFLYVETSIRITRLKKREMLEQGYIKNEFIKWASVYDTGPEYGRSLIKHEKWLSERKSKIIRIEGNFTSAEKYRILAEKIN